jgi:hypothetical protein
MFEVQIFLGVPIESTATLNYTSGSRPPHDRPIYQIDATDGADIVCMQQMLISFAYVQLVVKAPE